MDEAVAKAQEIRGWMELEELLWLNQTAKNMDSIVELGCFCGRSTYALLSGCMEHNAGHPNGTVYAVDCHWCGTMYPFYDGA